MVPQWASRHAIAAFGRVYMGGLFRALARRADRSRPDYPLGSPQSKCEATALVTSIAAPRRTPVAALRRRSRSCPVRLSVRISPIHSVWADDSAAASGTVAIATSAPGSAVAPVSGGATETHGATAMHTVSSHIRCPRCRGQICDLTTVLPRCSNAACMYSEVGFVRAGGQPVLIDFDRSIFERDAYRDGRGSVFPR